MTAAIRPKDDLWIEDLDEEIVILAGDTDQIHVLNETAAELWRLVDGVRDADALAAALNANYPDVSQETIAGDVALTLAKWRDLGLIALRRSHNAGRTSCE